MADPRLFHMLHLCHRAVFRAADRALTSRFGITAAQHAALMFLAEQEGASMSALAAAVGLKPAAVSGLIDRMEKNGFLERCAAAKDRRSFELFLKPAGRDIVKESKVLIEESNRYLLEGIDDETREQIADFLEKVTVRAEAYSGEAINENEELAL